MTRDEFSGLIEEALTLIPPDFRDAMRNIAIIVEDHPPAEILQEMEIEAPDTLYGLYLGTPITER